MNCVDCGENLEHKNQAECIENLIRMKAFADAVAAAAKKVVVAMGPSEKIEDKKTRKLVIELEEAIRSYPV